MPPLEAWEKVFFGNSAYFEDVHASIGCINCHGGTSGTGDMEAAHQGMVAHPDQAETCGTCHANIVEDAADSLHFGLQGYMDALQARADEETMPQIMEAYNNHCAECHASCGQCHVSRPTSTGGGLLDGHLFKDTPPPYTTCTGCHGSRVENEYKGKNKDAEGESIPADVHYNPGGMNCNDCHSGDEMHGATGDFEHRYDGAAMPACTDADCHADVGPGGEIAQHTEAHLEQLSCQVCHATTYKNCYNCHVAQSEEGVPFFKTDDSQMLFLIGLNPLQSEERPWQYVPLRHVPISPDSFEYYGENLLPNFDNRPTWAYATPHDIQRVTPQNQSCAACHDNPDIFLTKDKVAESERAANAEVIVEQVPSFGAPAQPEPTEEPGAEPTAEPTEEPVEEPEAGLPELPDYPIEAYQGVETCAGCHDDRHTRWAQGAHANAYADPIFQESWEAQNKPKYCLACHTTGFDPNLGEYAFEGVTCEQCHGPYSADHPPARVPIDRSLAICGTCHTVTFEEWDGTVHHQVGTDCLSCHDICTTETHEVGEGVTGEHAVQQVVCANCHHMLTDEFVHTTHASSELDCLTCHMQLGPEDIGAEGKIRTAHDFEVKPGVCIECHSEAIHGGDRIVSLRTQVQEMEQLVPSGITEEVEGLRDQVDDLENVATGRTWAGGFVGALVGLTIGVAGFWLWRKRTQ